MVRPTVGAPYFEGVRLPKAIVEYLKQFKLRDHEEVLRDIVYKERVVPMDEFILSDNYCGLSSSIFPRLVPILSYVDQQEIQEVDMNWGRGGGKTTGASLLVLRGVYKLLCYRDPRQFLGSIRNKPIIGLNVSVSATQANDGVFATQAAIVEGSPWFRDKFEILTSRIRFIDNIEAVCGHSKATPWLGLDIFIAVLDEVNFHLDKKERSNAEELWDVIQESGKTRFPHHYKIVSISSSEGPRDFLSRRIEPLAANPDNKVEIPGLV